MTAQEIADDRKARETLTDDLVMSVMSPTLEKYGVIVARLEWSTGLSGSTLYRNVARVLQSMKRAGRVELVKGSGSGWRINKAVQR